MFNPTVIRQIYETVTARQTLAKFVYLQDSLNELFYGLEQPVRAMMLAIMSGESLLFIGPPGVAKSKLISTLCELTGIKPAEDTLAGADRPIERRDGGYFEYLLTPFTEPSELFGSLKVEDFGAAVARLGRHEAGMIHRSRIVFLDEVFNGSSAILNSLLALMNERRFHDRGLVKPAMLQTLFAASNLVPQQKELQAAFDRFVFRVAIENVEPRPASLEQLLRRAWALDVRPATDDRLTDIFDLAASLRQLIRQRRSELFAPGPNDKDLNKLAYIIHHAPKHALSNRRLVKLTEAMIYQRLLRAEMEGEIGDASMGPTEFELAWTFFLDPSRVDIEQRSEFRRILYTELAAG